MPSQKHNVVQRRKENAARVNVIHFNERGFSRASREWPDGVPMVVQVPKLWERVLRIPWLLFGLPAILNQKNLELHFEEATGTTDIVLRLPTDVSYANVLKYGSDLLEHVRTFCPETVGHTRLCGLSHKAMSAFLLAHGLRDTITGVKRRPACEPVLVMCDRSCQPVVSGYVH